MGMSREYRGGSKSIAGSHQAPNRSRLSPSGTPIRRIASRHTSAHRTRAMKSTTSKLVMVVWATATPIRNSAAVTSSTR